MERVLKSNRKLSYQTTTYVLVKSHRNRSGNWSLWKTRAMRTSKTKTLELKRNQEINIDKWIQTQVEILSDILLDSEDLAMENTSQISPTVSLRALWNLSFFIVLWFIQEFMTIISFRSRIDILNTIVIEIFVEAPWDSGRSLSFPISEAPWNPRESQMRFWPKMGVSNFLNWKFNLEKIYHDKYCIKGSLGKWK